MLAAGCRVVTHGRVETEALLKGLPNIPLKKLDYKDVQLDEFDLDAVLSRRPSFVLLGWNWLTQTFLVHATRSATKMQQKNYLMPASMSMPR